MILKIISFRTRFYGITPHIKTNTKIINDCINERCIRRERYILKGSRDISFTLSFTTDMYKAGNYIKNNSDEFDNLYILLFDNGCVAVWHDYQLSNKSISVNVYININNNNINIIVLTINTISINVLLIPNTGITIITNSIPFPIST